MIHSISMLAVGAAGGATAPSMLSLGVWAMCLAFFVMLINALLKLAARLRGKAPKPPNAELDIKMRTLEARVEKIEGSQMKTADEVHAMHLTLIKSEEERATRLHERIDPLAQNTAAIKGSMEAFTTSFNNMTQLLMAHMARNS